MVEEPNLCVVATVTKDGAPMTNPAWIDFADGLIRVNSAEGRTWPDNLRRDPRVSIAVLNRENPYEYVAIRGRVVNTTHDGADEQINALAKKYLGEDEYPFRQPGEQRLLIEIEPEHVHHYGT